MRGVLLEVPKQLLEQRRRLGLDGQDEMWDGVVHLVPPAGGKHQRFGARLFVMLFPIAERRGLVASYETGLFASDEDYRVPDQLFCRPDQRSERGAEGAELVVEIRSPDDETYDKLDFYAARAVTELLVAHPGDRSVELLRLVGERLLPVVPEDDGTARSEVLGVGFRTVAGRLRLSWDGGSAEI